MILIVMELSLVKNTPRTEGGSNGNNPVVSLIVGLRAKFLNTTRSTPPSRVPVVVPNIGRPQLRMVVYYDDTLLTSPWLLPRATAIFLVCLIGQIGSGLTADAHGR